MKRSRRTSARGYMHFIHELAQRPRGAAAFIRLARLVMVGAAFVGVCAAEWPARTQALAQAQQPAQPAPTMKGRARPVMPRARAQRWYDRERDVTYVNVDIPLDSPGGQRSETPAGQRSEAPGGQKGKSAKGAPKSEAQKLAPPREVVLVFQLIFKGRATADLAMAYLLVQATGGREERARLDAVEQIEIDAEGYQYRYARMDYQTELIEAKGAHGPLPLKREAAAFQLPPEDLPQMANVNSLKVKLGPERFTVKSPQLTDLRRTLVSGGDD